MFRDLPYDEKLVNNVMDATRESRDKKVHVHFNNDLASRLISWGYPKFKK